MRNGISKNIYESAVRRMIVGDFAPGEILTDVGLARLFGTSELPFGRRVFAWLMKAFCG